MSQAEDCDLFLCADDLCLLYTGKDIKDIEDNLNQMLNVCDWFVENCLCDWLVENKRSVHFGEEKTKPILFGTKRRLKCDVKIEVKRGDIKMNQHKEVTYLRCFFDSNLSGEGMAIKVLNKVNSILRFIYRKQNNPLRRLLCNALIQRLFDYSCHTWLPSLANKIQSMGEVLVLAHFSLVLRVGLGSF